MSYLKNSLRRNKMDDETITVNNVEYVRADKVSEKASLLDGLEYVIIRTKSAGVFSGYLKSKEGSEIELLKARRFYQWHGSATLSQFAQVGTSKPSKCKFPVEVDSITLLGVIEIITVTAMAKNTIDEVPIWKA